MISKIVIKDNHPRRSMPHNGVHPHKKFEGIYLIEGEGEERLGTRSLAPGENVYGEETVKVGDEEYRIWDPFRSKLAAAILKGLHKIPIREKSKILYLGAASGTTVSHVSDIVGPEGKVYCVEFAQRSFRDLVNNVSKNRINTVPIFEDARFPSRYRTLVSEVDSVYCDIAQPDQARILAENLDTFLDPGNEFLMAIKARSIDVTKDPNAIFRREADILQKRGYSIEEMVQLQPFEKDHCMVRGGK